MAFRSDLLNQARQERDVTGLETAIILIAFVVVASVFAFTVRSTGIFSAERGKETIHARRAGARSSMELKGSIVSNSVSNQTLSTGDSAWTAVAFGSTSTPTSTADTTDKKQGTGSGDLVINAAYTAQLAAYSDLSATVDLSSIDSITLWVKSATSTTAGEFEIVLDNTAACGRSLENIDIPALVAGTWTSVTLGISDNSDMTAIKCVGFNITTDNGAQTVNLDNIVAQGQATSVLITLANVLEGEPIDLSEPGDSDANGLSDSDSNHTLIVTYTDKNQVVRDVYWTKTFVGQNDSDDLLEAGEKMELTVNLTGLSNSCPVIGHTRFDMEIRAESGGSIVVERTMPDLIDTVMNLN